MDLKQFFEEYNRVAIAFSGGVDSAYLLYSAVENGADVVAYYVKSPFQPQFELDDARRLCSQLGAKLTVISLDVLADPLVRQNDSLRCYYCKRNIFSAIINQARLDGFTVILDGTNASDDAGDRPGMRALQELMVLSPLRICGITKDEIRALSRKAGLFTWDKPAYACLATRIYPNEKVTADALSRIERAESFLHSLGFINYRVRVKVNNATILILENQLDLFKSNENIIFDELLQYFDSVEFSNVFLKK